MAAEAALSGEEQSRFRLSAEMTDALLTAVCELVVVGAKPSAVVAAGRELGVKLGGLKKKGKVERGFAVPVSVCVNGVVSNWSPVQEVEDEEGLVAGDVVRVDVGLHVGGCAAVGARTVVVGDEGADDVANVIKATHVAYEAAVRSIVGGASNEAVTAVIGQVAEAFGVHVVEGVLSHNMEPHVIDGAQVIIGKETVEQQVAQFDFEPSSVFALDIVFASSDEKLRELESNTTVYKRNGAAATAGNMLKSKAGRKLSSIVRSQAPAFLFTAAELETDLNLGQIKLGLSEMVSSGVIIPYPVIYGHPGQHVAQFKGTVLINNAGERVSLVHPGPLPAAAAAAPDPELSEDLTTLLAAPLTTAPKKKKRNKKKKKAAAAAPDGQ